MATNNQMDILVEIPDEDLAKLMELYKQNWPHWIIPYNHIKVYSNWKIKYKQNIRFYCPEGKWNDGAFVVISEDPKYILFMCSLESGQNRLLNALKTTDQINWNQLPSFAFINKDHYNMLLELIRHHGLKPSLDLESYILWLPMEKVLSFKIEIPDGYYFSALETSHVNSIYSVWPHKQDLPSSYLANMITFNEGVGLFSKDNDILCSYIMRNEYGMLATLQTSEHCKRKGFATLVVKYICKQLAERGCDSFAVTLVKNEVSKTMFEKIGFEEIGFVNWMKTDYL